MYVFLNLLCKIFIKNMVHHLVCAMCKQLKWLQKRVKVHFPFSQETILYSKKVYLSEGSLTINISWFLLKMGNLGPKSLYRSQTGRHFMEQKMIFGLVWSQFTILGPIMSNFWGCFFMFSIDFKFFLETLKRPH